MAPIEAAGCGTPPIMTRNCGAAERLVDGVHCVKIERTVEELVDAMHRIIARQLDLAKIGRAARSLVASDLSFSKCLRQIEEKLQTHATGWRHEAADDKIFHCWPS